ncbi:MAG: polysaccharide deacetylase family protein [Verrucomicrobia bacterium]|jgi:peptidoglycan/xylan/chitin deacetylase (PgdA/CDA1 family)|nr:polysaccharide deacetylase family protein [Verrucomicrobiota bacterium]
MSTIFARVIGKYQRTASRVMFRRMIRMRNPQPIVTFTFDDFPQSALRVGGEILRTHGMCGTYYASLGLMNQVTPTGLIFSPDDLPSLIAQGHELGCHTFAHCDSWETAPAEFERSVEKNRLALERLQSGVRFPTLSYPITCPRPHTKRRVARRFGCCRFGGQTYNREMLDLNLVSAHFLEKDRGEVSVVAGLVDETLRNGGWLVIATHDIADDHTPYGCTPAFFEAVVRHVANSGALVLPMAKALEQVRGGS